MGEIYIDPVNDIGGLLLTVEKPGRYAGGEAGILTDKDTHVNASLRTLIAFPDLYEIGMGNQALKIIYNRLNAIDGISCDRSFAPAPDFEKLLKEKNIPLYGLDTGAALKDFDILLFTIGYELGLGGLLLMLEASQIPQRCEARNEMHPVIIAGGPAVSNPLPFSPFADAFWMGEAEDSFFDLMQEITEIKKRGQGREALLEKIASHPNIWVKGKEKAVRAIYSNFSEDKNAYVFPLPSMKIVNNHGAVEIMRGCPNGCRFCHAGFWYRPMRQKGREEILSLVQDIAAKGGWREISLSSLSSGDYDGIGELIDTLNSLYKDRHISFQLPSLKVSSFSLSILEKISLTRKSGLTFAVETPHDLWQLAINKEVTADSVVSILGEARKRGWKSAKFYFMIGLPLPAIEKNEEEEIVNFILDIAKRTRMNFNLNIGIYIPKPHTPFQGAPQIDSAEAVRKMDYIRSRLKPMGHKVSTSDPITAVIEGLLSRGDERAGQLFEKAYLRGSRLEAWSEYFNKDIWQSILEENRETVNSILSAKPILPWQGIDPCVKSEYLKHEFEKSINSETSPPCRENCLLCGVCSNKTGVRRSQKPSVNHVSEQVNGNCIKPKGDPAVYRVLFSFSKTASAVFHGHLSLVEIFSSAFARAEIPVKYTQGFNPLAKIEFASPLTTGISAKNEYAAADFMEKQDVDSFMAALNKSLPQGIRVEKAELFCIPSGAKKHSLSSLLWGFSYKGSKGQIDFLKASEEKAYRQSRAEDRASLFNLKRCETLAKNITGSFSEWASYFEVYRHLYPNSCN